MSEICWFPDCGREAFVDYDDHGLWLCDSHANNWDAAEASLNQINCLDAEKSDNNVKTKKEKEMLSRQSPNYRVQRKGL